MGAIKSSLSAGEIIRAVLVEDAEMSARVTKVFPVVVDEAKLPYIVYRRSSLDQNPAKDRRGADTVAIEVLCFTADYASGVDLAEAVRNALDGKQAESDGMVMRSCFLTDSEEAWENDAYVQQLVFTIKI